MKKSHIIILAMVATAATAFMVVEKTNAEKKVSATPANIVWFNTIEIAKGITVEFEYGAKLEVFVEGNKALVEQMAVVLENQVLRATGKDQFVPVEGIKIRVVTPVLINLALDKSSDKKDLSKAISEEKLRFSPLDTDFNLQRL